MNPFIESTVARPLSDSSAAQSITEPRTTDSSSNTSSAAAVTEPTCSEPYADSDSTSTDATSTMGTVTLRATRDLSVRHASNTLRRTGRRARQVAVCSLRCKGAINSRLCPSVAYKKKRRSFLAAALSAVGLAAGLSLGMSAAALAVDVNAATQAQLEAVRGIGPKTAEIIIQERTRGGHYESFDDLSDRVKGIGPKKAASLQASGLTLGRSASAEAGAASSSSIPAASPGNLFPVGAALRSPGKPASAFGAPPAPKRRP